jgi:predicted ATP-dependent endonuclease of OLD family
MLRLAKLTIKNFRSIYSESFVLPSSATFVGKNDAGKSNIIEAIDVLLEGSKDSVTTSDFYDSGAIIEISASFEGATEYLELADDQNRTKIKERLDQNGHLLVRRIARADSGLGKIEVWDPKEEQYGTPTGIDAAIRAILPEPIYIESLADVGDQLKGTQRDALGKLVGQVVSVVEAKIEPSLKAAYAEANRQLNVQRAVADGTETDERVSEIRAIESEITGYLRETFPSLALRLEVNLPGVKQILGSVDVMVREGSHVDPYYRRGQGLQRSLYLSLLRALAARTRGEKKIKRPFIVLFEEAEAFLHPEGQGKMRAALEAISSHALVVFRLV